MITGVPAAMRSRSNIIERMDANCSPWLVWLLLAEDGDGSFDGFLANGGAGRIQPATDMPYHFSADALSLMFGPLARFCRFVAFPNMQPPPYSIGQVVFTNVGVGHQVGGDECWPEPLGYRFWSNAEAVEPAWAAHRMDSITRAPYNGLGARCRAVEAIEPYCLQRPKNPDRPLRFFAPVGFDD